MLFLQIIAQKKKNGSEFLTIEQCCKDDQFFFLRFYKKLFYDISIQ